jgi:hypothetical protein
MKSRSKSDEKLESRNESTEAQDVNRRNFKDVPVKPRYEYEQYNAG